MDSRSTLRMPSNFAFVIRTAGGNMRDNEFRIAYAISVGGVKAIAVIGHTDCGMSGLARRGRHFVRGMVENAGWNAERAERFFAESAPKFEIGDVVKFIVGEAERLRLAYPKILVAPLLYKVENELLYQIREKSLEVPASLTRHLSRGLCPSTPRGPHGYARYIVDCRLNPGRPELEQVKLQALERHQSTIQLCTCGVTPSGQVRECSSLPSEQLQPAYVIRRFLRFALENRDPRIHVPGGIR